MKGRRTLASAFAMMTGMFLIIEGIWGFVSAVVFMVLTTNKAHVIIHIILGISGLYLICYISCRQFNSRKSTFA